MREEDCTDYKKEIPRRQSNKMRKICTHREANYNMFMMSCVRKYLLALQQILTDPLLLYVIVALVPSTVLHLYFTHIFIECFRVDMYMEIESLYEGLYIALPSPSLSLSHSLSCTIFSLSVYFTPHTRRYAVSHIHKCAGKFTEELSRSASCALHGIRCNHIRIFIGICLHAAYFRMNWSL